MKSITFSPTATASDISSADKELAQHYLDVRSETESLCAALTPDDQMVQSMPECSPTKWHQAHTTWFFETFILTPHLSGYRPLDPRYRFLFNSYYKQVENKDAPKGSSHPLRYIRGTFSRPTLEEVQRYRRYVDEHVLRLLAPGRSVDSQLVELLTLGIHHEQQHQELLITDIKHAFWMNPLRPAYVNRPVPSDTSELAAVRWIDHEGGLQQIGHNGQGFAFDNESPRHSVFVEPFRIASRLVTNREYLEFMEDGGYHRPDLWLSDGWDTIQANGWDAPLYWEREERKWLVFTAGGTRELRLDEPVSHVSYFEADAYARWAGARLPSEWEWEVVAARTPINGNFLESRRFHPCSEQGDGSLNQLFGDVWEWTSSPYIPYPGYQPAKGALGEYNAKFMCSQLVLRGGSCATPRSHIRATYRNFFPPQTRWQYSGIRLAKPRD